MIKSESHILIPYNNNNKKKNTKKKTDIYSKLIAPYLLYVIQFLELFFFLFHNFLK